MYQLLTQLMLKLPLQLNVHLTYFPAPTKSNKEASSQTVQQKQVSEKSHASRDKWYLIDIEDLTQDLLPSNIYHKKQTSVYLESGQLQHFLMEMGHNTQPTYVLIEPMSK